jgi:hypothetical protein
MTLPGFSAETSLYKTGIHYHLTGGSVQAGGIVPQLFLRPECRPPCPNVPGLDIVCCPCTIPPKCMSGEMCHFLCTA